MRRRSLLALLLTACAPSLTTVPAGTEFELSPGVTVRLELTSLAPPNLAGTPTPPAAYRARIRWSTP